jgi:hypothetical protein
LRLQAKEGQDEEQRQQQRNHEQAETTGAGRANHRGADNANNGQRNHEASSLVAVAHMNRSIAWKIVVGQQKIFVQGLAVANQK